PARRPYHYSHLRRHPPPQSPYRTQRRSRSHDHMNLYSLGTSEIPEVIHGGLGAGPMMCSSPKASIIDNVRVKLVTELKEKRATLNNVHISFWIPRLRGFFLSFSSVSTS